MEQVQQPQEELLLESSLQLGELVAALCKFKLAMSGGIAKKGKNPFYKSTFLTFDDLLEAVREPLAENGLAVMQFPCAHNDLITMLVHTSGQYIKARFKYPRPKEDPHAIASAQSYFGRRAVMFLLGIFGSDDDDGNKAQQAFTSSQGQTKIQ